MRKHHLRLLLRYDSRTKQLQPSGRPAEPQIFTLWPFSEKACQPSFLPHAAHTHCVHSAPCASGHSLRTTLCPSLGRRLSTQGFPDLRERVPRSVRLSAVACLPQLSGRCHGRLYASPAVCHSLSVCHCGGGCHHVPLTASRTQYKHAAAEEFPACVLPGSWTIRPSPFSPRLFDSFIQRWPRLPGPLAASVWEGGRGPGPPLIYLPPDRKPAITPGVSTTLGGSWETKAFLALS